MGGRRATCRVLGIDNLPGLAWRSTRTRCRERCVMLFGQEGPGLSERGARARARRCSRIRQFGSTRSINAAAASAVAMHEWIRRHVPAAER